MPIEDVLQLIESDEGCRLMPYRDTLGLLTVGWGRCLDTHGISQLEADFMLHNDILGVYGGLELALPWFKSLDDVRQAVLIDMSFNLGVHGLLGFHDMLGAMQTQNWQGAHDACLASRAAQQLSNRYHRLAQMLLTGTWPT